MKRISIKLALVAALTVASTMSFAADPGQPAKPAPNMQGNGDMPMLFKVLISETTQVIRIDSSKGMTKAP